MFLCIEAHCHASGVVKRRVSYASGVCWLAPWYGEDNLPRNVTTIEVAILSLMLTILSLKLCLGAGELVEM